MQSHTLLLSTIICHLCPPPPPPPFSPHLFICHPVISDDWAGTLGNPSKIGLAVLTMSYDVLFMIQHFILYNKSPSVFGQRKRRVTDDYRQKFDEYQAHVSPQKNTTIVKKSAKVYEM